MHRPSAMAAALIIGPLLLQATPSPAAGGIITATGSAAAVAPSRRASPAAAAGGGGSAAAAAVVAQPAKIALYYSGWQLVGQREDQPTVGDVNNVTRVQRLVGRGFTHGMLAHGNDAILLNGTVVSGSNCSGWTPASRTCAARFLFENGLASYMTIGLNFHRFFEDPGKIPMPTRRQYSPFVNRTAHLLAMQGMTANLRAQSPYLAGVLNDLEYGCWPSNGGIGNATSEQLMFPDLQERLGNAPSAMAAEGWPSFTDWPAAKAHPVPLTQQQWTLEQLMYNMPKPWAGSASPGTRSNTRDATVARVSGSPGGKTTMFAQIFEPSATRRLTRIDLWLRLSASTLPQMPYISYFITKVKADGFPDVDNPLQCATLRPKDRMGGKFVKCGVSAKELPTALTVTGLSPDWQPMKLYFNPEEAQLTKGTKYALVLENCPLDTCWLSAAQSDKVRRSDTETAYEIAVHNGGTAAGAMVFTDGAWKALSGAAAASVFYEPGSTGLGYTPNQLHADWVAFHANTTANEVKEMAAIAKTIPALNSTNGKTLDVVAYSGYAGTGIYDPSSMSHYGDLTEKYGVDWEVLSAAGLTVAMVGYGNHPITPILDAVAKGSAAAGNPGKSCPVVCGVISGTQAQFAQRYNTCAAAQGGDGLVMEYDGHHTFDNDLGFHVPGYDEHTLGEEAGYGPSAKAF